MATEIWVPKPEPSIWDKVKCFFGFHDFENPTKEKSYTGEFYCKGKCGSFVFWNCRIPVSGEFKVFGKVKKVRVHILEVKK